MSAGSAGSAGGLAISEHSSAISAVVKSRQRRERAGYSQSRPERFPPSNQPCVRRPDSSASHATADSLPSTFTLNFAE